MPRSARQCSRFVLAVKALMRYPLFEELDLPRLPELGGAVARDAGRALVAALVRHEPAFVGNSLADDALEDAFGAERAARLRDDCADKPVGLSVVDLAHAALGGQLVAMALELEAMKGVDEIVPHHSFEAAWVAGAKNGVQRLLEERRADLHKLDELIGSLRGELAAC